MGEDMNMEPILGVYAGLHIDNGARIITGDALKPHVQEALEEIEYITGDTSTIWGARRAKDGHPQPFKLRYVEVGNEDWLNMGTASYDARFAMFYDAIKASTRASRSSPRCDRRTGISSTAASRTCSTIISTSTFRRPCGSALYDNYDRKRDEDLCR